MNFTEEERKFYLEILQSQTNLVMIPSLIFLSLLLVTGVIGNSLVLLVYWRKRSKTPEKTFIMVMAVFDLLTNLITIPGEMYVSLNNWDYDHPNFCRIHQYIISALVMGSAFVLGAIAVTRYRKICQPFYWQVSVTQSKVITAAIAVSSLLCAIPLGVLNGRQTKPTPRPGIHGYICDIDDAYVETIWPMVNSIFLFSIFVLGFIPMLALYVLIGRLAHRHGAVSGKSINWVASHRDEVSSEVDTKSTDDNIATSTTGEERGQIFKDNKKPGNDGMTSIFVELSRKSLTPETSFTGCQSGQYHVAKTDAATPPDKTIKKYQRLSRTTSMLLAVTLVFVISFLPFLALECFKATAPDVILSLSDPSLAVFHLFYRSFLINSAANPIIYSVCNVKFRKECLKLFTCF